MIDHKKPTFIVHTDDDQIVPIDASAVLTSMNLNGGASKLFRGRLHATCSTIKNEVYAGLHVFLKAGRSASTY